MPQYQNSKEHNSWGVTAKHGEYGFLFCCSVPFKLLWPCEKLWPLILELLVEAAVNSVSMIS